MNPDPRREPPADMRQAAKACRDMYLSLRAEGFTRGEALTIIGQIISASMPGGDR